MPRAYSISAPSIAAERERVGGRLEDFDIARVVKLEETALRPMGPGDVHLRILAVSGEHNINHAALADTVNITELRGGKIYPGNSAVGEVVAVGANVTKFAPGDIVVTHCNGEPDVYGYPLRIWAYDQPESIGWYGEEAVVGEWQLVPAPLDCGLNLWEIAALPLRAPTAYHMWRRALGIYRLKVSRERKAVLNVLSFGGGVGECFLMLARSEGHNAFFCSGTPERRDALQKLGIVGIDQKQFHRFAGKGDVRAFTEACKKLTGGEQMHIVADMLRGPVFAAGLAVAAREGVNVSAGWQLSQVVEYNSTLMSVKQVTIDHTHYETVDGCWAATELYGRVFKPTVHKEIYAFEDLPRAFHEMHQNVQTGIPIVRVATQMPEAVKRLV
ncbi:MAG: zinc-binding alcohol dehydrogenase family protein [Deltaproteobacteria bacterium]|nr:zinc-binding alcohol dehydrogenase family protein [Deltaproteobacteria bacterium]